MTPIETRHFRIRDSYRRETSCEKGEGVSTIRQSFRARQTHAGPRYTRLQDTVSVVLI